MILSFANHSYGYLPPINNYDTSPITFTGMVDTGATSADWSTYGTLASNLAYPLGGFELADYSSFYSTNNNTNAAAILEVSYTIGSDRQVIVESMPLGGLTQSRSLFFPIFVPQGATLQWRIRTVRTGLTSIPISFSGKPMGGPNTGLYRPFGGCKCFGLDTTNLRGVSVSEGTTNLWAGADVSVGATDVEINAIRLLPHWQGNTLTTAGTFFGRIRKGVGGQELFRCSYRSETSEAVRSISNTMPTPMYLPSGTPLSVQAWGAASATDLYYVVQGFYYSL